MFSTARLTLPTRAVRLRLFKCEVSNPTPTSRPNTNFSGFGGRSVGRSSGGMHFQIQALVQERTSFLSRFESVPVGRGTGEDLASEIILIS